MHEKHRASCVYCMCGKLEKERKWKRDKGKESTFLGFNAESKTPTTHKHTRRVSQNKAWCLGGSAINKTVPVIFISYHLVHYIPPYSNTDSSTVHWVCFMQPTEKGCFKTQQGFRRLHVSLRLNGERAAPRRAANLASFPRIPYRLHQLIMI